MEFSYQKDFGDNSQPDAYERVLVDAVRGDHTLFATSEEVLASWRIVQPVLDAWSKSGDNLKDYKQGSTGPSGNTV
jgi:glucose-6-phosphate 1-dehydrogenase